MKTSYLFLANGFEEIEALGTVDVLRRGGLDVKTVSISDSNEVVGAHSVKVIADALICEIDTSDAEWLILPGGMPGATNLYECETLREMLLAHNAKGGKIGAICASPAVVLGQMGLLEGKEATCYPGFEELCKGAKMIDARGVVDGNIVTANGPSSTLNLAYEILKIELGKMRADKVMNDMLLYPQQKINEYY